MGTHPNTDSYLLTLAKWLKQLFIKEAKEQKWEPLGVAFTIFLNPGTNYNPLKGIHLNTWSDYADFIDYLFIMGYETASSKDYSGISPMNWLVEMLSPFFTWVESKHNLILGIPFYGHKEDWTTGRSTAIVADDYMAYLSRLTEKHPYKLKWNEVSCEHFLKNGNDFITYPTLNVSSTDGSLCRREWTLRRNTRWVSAHGNWDKAPNHSWLYFNADLRSLMSKTFFFSFRSHFEATELCWNSDFWTVVVSSSSLSTTTTSGARSFGTPCF